MTEKATTLYPWVSLFLVVIIILVHCSLVLLFLLVDVLIIIHLTAAGTWTQISLTAIELESRLPCIASQIA